MSQTFEFDTHEDLLKKWDELRKDGISKERLTVYAPNPVHGLDEYLDPKPSPMRYFTLIGGIIGVCFGYGICLYTNWLSWPINVGGKSNALSIPAYTIIGFEMTILFAGLISFAGLMILGKMPNIKNIINPPVFGNKFAIVVEDEEL